MRSNPLRILRVLDGYLKNPFDLYVFGRSALALGFETAPATFHTTMDVDAILPARDMTAIESNEDFWQAQLKTNEELADSGLYITHLFEDKQVILSAYWLDHVVALSGFGFSNLRLFRPSIVDLILTKMMRVDPQDREDILFLTAQTDFDQAKLKTALDNPIIPEVAEILEAFELNKAWLEKTLGL